MKLQDQVCTLEHAKRLSELGVRQGLSTFFWDDYEGKHELMMNETPEDGYEPDEENTCFSAFAVGELMTMLPPSISFVKKYATLRLVKCDDNEHYGHGESYLAGYYLSEKEPVKDWVMGHGRDHAAEALADLLIMIIEQGKTTVTEINNRLTS